MIPLPGLSGIKTTLILGGVIVLLSGIFYAYHRWTTAEMEVLRQEVTAQKARADAFEEAQRVLRADVEAVRQSQEEFARTTAAARERAASASRAVRERDLRTAARTNREQLEGQINSDTADAFRKLEETTRAR